MTGRQRGAGMPGRRPAGIGSEHTGFSSDLLPNGPEAFSFRMREACPSAGAGRKQSQAGDRIASRVPAGTDLVEWYFEQGWTDGLPVVPPTREAVDAVVAVLGGDPDLVECRVPPRLGNLTREVLAINLVMAGCKPEYAPVVRAALLALTMPAFNLNGVQATTHMAAPLLIVNGPEARRIGMNGGVNAFGSGNRANATIGRAIRLVLLNVGGGVPGDLDKSTLGHPGKYTYAVAENEEDSPWAPYHVEKGFSPDEFDRVRDRRRAAAQRHEPRRRRPRGHSRQHLLGDEHRSPTTTRSRPGIARS